MPNVTASSPQRAHNSRGIPAKRLNGNSFRVFSWYNGAMQRVSMLLVTTLASALALPLSSCAGTTRAQRFPEFQKFVLRSLDDAAEEIGKVRDAMPIEAKSTTRPQPAEVSDVQSMIDKTRSEVRSLTAARADDATLDQLQSRMQEIREATSHLQALWASRS